MDFLAMTISVSAILDIKLKYLNIYNSKDLDGLFGMVGFLFFMIITATLNQILMLGKPMT